MKHNIIIIVCLSLIVIAAASCSKKLDEYNPSNLTTESFFTTADGIETAVNGAYSYNRYFYGKGEGAGLLEVGTDLWTSGSNDPAPELTTYSNLTADQSYVGSTMWKQCYAAINLINQALVSLPTAGVTAQRAPVLEGELRFLRAWYYWHLVETFGDTHFTLEPTTSLITTANRTPVATIYNQIFADMNFAVNNVSLTTTEYGKITRPIAEAFLARLYLTRGMNQEASNMANKVIKGYTYQLGTFSDLWNIAKEKNAEVIWGLNYSSNLTLNAGSNILHSLFLMDYTTFPGMIQDLANGLSGKRYMPTRFLLNLFNENDDARYNVSFKSAWFANNPKATERPVGMNLGDTAGLVSKYVIPAADRIGKKYQIYDINDVYDNTTGKPKDRIHYISLKKFDDATRPAATQVESGRDFFIIRLAEMYMIGAEAQMKLSKTDSAAYFINALRAKRAVPGHEAAMQVLPAAVTLDFILDERAREFAGEEMRWFDLKRTGKLIERVKLDNPDAAPYIKDFHVVRPIPQAQLTAVTNKDEFKQTTGYN